MSEYGMRAACKIAYEVASSGAIVVSGMALGIDGIASCAAIAAGGKTVAVEVVHGDGSTKTETYATDYEYLGELLLENGLIEGEDGPYGLYIKTVDGETADYSVDKAYWALFEGEDYATQGIDLTVIEDGDTFRLVYTIG